MFGKFLICLGKRMRERESEEVQTAISTAFGELFLHPITIFAEDETAIIGIIE